MDDTIKLRVINMTKLYNNGDGVKNVDLDVHTGELVTLLGPSGCGKTTILRTIGGFIDLTDGDITIDGKSIITLPPEKRPTSMVFQSYNLWPHMTVHDNLEFGLKLRKIPKDVREHKIAYGLNLVKMNGFEKKYPNQMSGGQQQRIAIARALLNKPKAILADEPTGNLDGETADEILQLLMDLNQEGTAIVMVTHNRAIFEKYPGRVFSCQNERCQEVIDEGIDVTL